VQKPPKEFASYREAQDYAKRTNRVCLLEGATNRQRLLSPDQYDIVNVRTSLGVKHAILMPKAALKALWAADAPFREAMAAKRERLRAVKKKRADEPATKARDKKPE